MEKTATARRVGGRPRRRKYKTNERVPLSLRVQPHIKKLIDSASERTGRSQSMEAEVRLEQSAHTEGLLPDALLLRHGIMGARLIMRVSTALEAVRQVACHLVLQERGAWNPDDWLKDPRCYAEVEAAFARILARVRPANPVMPPPALVPTPTTFNGLGAWAADWAMVDYQMELFEQRLAAGHRKSMQDKSNDRSQSK
jgi:hypothetical protein